MHSVEITSPFHLLHLICIFDKVHFLFFSCFHGQKGSDYSS